jgi:predicted nucleic acid-binding protein
VSRRLVCDASAMTALLLDGGDAGSWVANTVSGAALLAPGFACWETANIIRRHELRAEISSDQANQAHADLLDLDIEYWPYELLATRSWHHRHNLSIYDSSYVALAELDRCALVTLDERIVGAPGLSCPVLTPAC